MSRWIQFNAQPKKTALVPGKNYSFGFSQEFHLKIRVLVFVGAGYR